MRLARRSGGVSWLVDGRGEGSWRRPKSSYVRTDPIGEFLPAEFAGRKLKDRLFLFIQRRLKLVSVQNQHRFQSSVANPLVAVHERMIHDQRECEGSRLLSQVGIKLLPAESHE